MFDNPHLDATAKLVALAGEETAEVIFTAAKAVRKHPEFEKLGLPEAASIRIAALALYVNAIVVEQAFGSGDPEEMFRIAQKIAKTFTKELDSSDSGDTSSDDPFCTFNL